MEKTVKKSKTDKATKSSKNTKATKATKPASAAKKAGKPGQGKPGAKPETATSKTAQAKYNILTVECLSCGNSFKVGSTYSKSDNLKVSVCDQCHPFYTGKTNRMIDESGRIEKFNKKYNRTN